MPVRAANRATICAMASTTVVAPAQLLQRLGGIRRGCAGGGTAPVARRGMASRAAVSLAWTTTSHATGFPAGTAAASWLAGVQEGGARNERSQPGWSDGMRGTANDDNVRQRDGCGACGGLGPVGQIDGQSAGSDRKKEHGHPADARERQDAARQQH